MNYIDILILILLAWFAFKGFAKGLVIELVSILALVLGIYGGLKFSHIVSNLLVDDLDGKYLPLVSFTITFAVIVVVVFIIGKLIEKIINLAALKIANKLAGGVFGMIKMALIISVVITILESYDRKIGFIPKEMKESSLFYKPMLNIAEQILPELEKNQLLQGVKEDLSDIEIQPTE